MCNSFWRRQTRPAGGLRESHRFPGRRTHHQRSGSGIAAGGLSRADRSPRPESRQTKRGHAQVWRDRGTGSAPRGRVGDHIDCCGAAGVRSTTVETNSRFQTCSTSNSSKPGCGHSPIDVTFETRFASKLGTGHAQSGQPQWPGLNRTDVYQKLSGRCA